MGTRRPYVFNIAGFDFRKNLPVLLSAFARFRDRGHREWRLVIAGAPHTQNPVVFPPIEPLIGSLGIENSVELTGVVTNEQRISLYSNASMYVSPSLSEGFGLTCIEAMASGVPTIGSNRGSLPEVISDGGFTVEPDVASMADAMTSVADSSHVYRTLQSRGLQRAAGFTWDETAKRTTAAYLDALD